ncbi:hypoxia induced protein conserved region-domain-containing protein [Tricharina praecox]|uniref:hypoxia induced protein conserved region-domain-containing protein n=1 Tax=Tricharina praecox TaxID=43433 RepID=UPI00221EFC5C|nr:hypoxia induced protein conserved region-domain-containing protein [Tricharina praecox]KAI5858394.1 hypoxia induced protein conserved region-domain-containing protein [Tricharina praecox]
MSGRPLPSSFDDDPDFYEENRLAKLGRRLKEEPLIPLGCALTCFALYKATRSIRSGNKEQTNKMFRARIYAQGFTLVAMVGGSYYYQEQREKEKSRDATIAERKSKEKQQAWIRELEVRDREDRELIERAKKLSARRLEAEKQMKEEQEAAAAAAKEKP